MYSTDSADWACGDKDETVNHIISKDGERAQKEFQNRHDWDEKMIHRELFKILLKIQLY